MEIVRDLSVNGQPEMTPLARRRLANVAIDLEMGSFVKAEHVDAVSDDLRMVERGLRQKIVGQDEAVTRVVSALECAELRNPKRPIASFLFLGPTGVGKSETAKELADLLHDGDDNAFLHIDCTELSGSTAVSALLGAAPEYVGREQAPFLDPKIIEQDKSVILFDEIEKGHPKLHDLLLKILEEGRVTLMNGGQTVSFRNSIIIMTSNVGSSEIMNLAGGRQIGFATREPQVPTKKSIDNAAYGALKKTFKPEFINRIDHRVTYGPLSDEQLGEVLDNYVYELTQSEQLRSRNLGLTLTPEVIDTIVSQSPHRQELGARPVLRRFEQTVWHKFARNVNGGSIPNDSWSYALLSQDENADAEIPVDFVYTEIPPVLRPQEMSSVATIDPQEITDSETMIS